METRAPSLRALLLPAAFALVFACLTMAVWSAFHGPLPLSPHSYRIHMALPDATNLAAGSDVQIAGVDIGRITTIESGGGRPTATVEIDHRYAPIRTGAWAIPRTKSLLGEGYIEIAPGPVGATAIPENGDFPRGHVRRAQDLPAVLETFDPSARRNIRQLVNGLSETFGDRSTELSATLGDARPVAQNLDTFMGLLAAQRGDLSRLLAKSSQVFDAIGAREGTLRAALEASQTVLTGTARRSREIAAIVHALPPVLTQARTTFASLGRTSSSLDALITSAEPAVPLVTPSLRATVAAAPEARKLFEDLPPLLRTGDTALPAVDRIAGAAGSAFATLYPTAREAIPFLQLLDTSRRSLTTLFANTAQMTNGTIVGPDGKPAHAFSAWFSLWNETLSGWKKRLPTNRPNAYPKPDAGQAIATGGLLSYDCRQVNNRLYIPATGGKGAPPCRLQGPWTFNGKSAYYPRPGLASP